LLELGSDRLVEGFEEQLIGAQAGESRSVEVDFPEDYRAEELAGKHATFDVDVKEVKHRELPALDDDFAAEASEFETLEELRGDIDAKLRASQESSIEDEFREAAVDAAVGEAEIDLTKELVSARAEEMWARTERALARQGVDPKTYLEATGTTQEQVIRESMVDAAEALAREAVLEAVADAESIEISDDEVLEALGEAAKAEDADPAAVLERLREVGRDGPIRRDLRLRKAVGALAESAKPIDPAKAKVREKIWTPEPDEQAAEDDRPEPAPESSKLWTPGDGDPAGTSGKGTR